MYSACSFPMLSLVYSQSETKLFQSEAEMKLDNIKRKKLFPFLIKRNNSFISIGVKLDKLKT